jgi:hypothetical protein
MAVETGRGVFSPEGQAESCKDRDTECERDDEFYRVPKGAEEWAEFKQPFIQVTWTAHSQPKPKERERD